MTDRTIPDDRTRQADEAATQAAHDADRPPSPDEEAAADTQSLDEGVADHHEEMLERGAHQKGEGRIG